METERFKKKNNILIRFELMELENCNTLIKTVISEIKKRGFCKYKIVVIINFAVDLSVK